MQLFRLLMCLAFLAGISGCRHTARSRGTTFVTDDGIVYLHEVVHVDGSSIPIIVIGRSGGPGKDHCMKYKMSDQRYLVEGVPLKPVAEPTVYFKEDGKVKTKAIPKSGVWLSLLDKRPTADQLQEVFELLERDPS